MAARVGASQRFGQFRAAVKRLSLRGPAERSGYARTNRSCAIEIQEALPGCGEPCLQGSVNGRRTFPRRRVSVGVIISYGAAWERSLEAQATDTSLGGLRLLTRQPFGRGTILRVRSTKAPARTPSVEVRVKSCN